MLGVGIDCLTFSFKLLHTDKIRREDDLSMPGRNTYVVGEGIRGPPIYDVTIL